MMKFNKRRVLIAPLDWGLGHATRCIPLVKAFIKLDWQVMIAADGAVEYLLRQEFPQLQFLKLPGYNVVYSESKLMLPLKIGIQVPKIISVIKKENQWLNRIIEQQEIDLVISDNRYGLYTEKVPCIFITHQLNIKAPFRWIEKKLQRLNWTYISKFTECWIPDSELNGLAGELSHPKELHPFPLRFIGPLSRFRRVMAPVKYKYLFLLSGPEPQRTLFEKKISRDISQIKDEVMIVRGKPGSLETFSFPGNVTVVNHLEGIELEKAMNSAEFIVSRSGYTTLMEIASLQKRSILIPTPGQTEQEYLAAHLMKKGFAFSVKQEDFELNKTLRTADQFVYRDFPILLNDLDDELEEFLQRFFQPQPQSSFATS
jgi:uncharacterized protein (TIGR00661 family)